MSDEPTEVRELDFSMQYRDAMFMQGDAIEAVDEVICRAKCFGPAGRQTFIEMVIEKLDSMK